MTNHVQLPGSALLALAGALCGLPSVAHAQPDSAKQASPSAKRDISAVQCRPGPVIGEGEPILIPAGRTTMIHVDGGVSAAQSTSANGVKTVPIADGILVQASQDVAPGTRINTMITGAQVPGGFSMSLEVVSTVPVWGGQYIVLPRAEMEAYEKGQREAQERDADKVRQEERDRLYKEAARRALAGDRRFYAQTNQPELRNDPILVRFLGADTFGTQGTRPTELLLPIEIAAKLQTSAPFDVDEPEVWNDESTTRLESRVILVDGPSSKGRALTTVALGERATIVIAIQLPANAEAPRLRVVFRRSAEPAVTAVGSDWVLRSAVEDTPEEYERKRAEIRQMQIAERKAEEEAERKREEAERKREEAERERERAERDRKLAKRTWIGAHVLGGLIWLDDGLPMTEQRDATSLRGVGARVSWGVVAMETGTMPMLSVEVNAAFATSGTARFGDTTIDGVQGELQRTATLGRVHAGLALRRGGRIVAALRAGLGVQAVSQDAELMTASGPVPGPESSLDVTGGFFVGGGVEARLGGNLAAGVGVTFIDSGGHRSLEGGVFLGYGLAP